MKRKKIKEIHIKRSFLLVKAMVVRRVKADTALASWELIPTAIKYHRADALTNRASC